MTQSATYVLALVVMAFIAGGAIIYAGSLLPQGRQRTHEIWPLYWSEFLIVGGALAAIAGGKISLFLIAFWIVARGEFEIFELFDRRSASASLLTGICINTCILLIAVFVPGWKVALSVLTACVAAGSLVVALQGRLDMLLILLSLFFPTLLLAIAIWLRGRADGFAWLFVAFAAVEAHDAFALLAGKLIGRHPLFPRLSPRKTWEGLAGGLAMGGLIGFVAARRLIGLAPVPAMLLTGALLLAGLTGDVLVSALKRWRGRKDFAPVAKAHGGILDICDSMLLAVPVLLLFQLAG